MISFATIAASIGATHLGERHAFRFDLCGAEFSVPADCTEEQFNAAAHDAWRRHFSMTISPALHPECPDTSGKLDTENPAGSRVNAVEESPGGKTF